MGKKTIRIGKTVDRNERGFINKHVTNDGCAWYYVFSPLNPEEDKSLPCAVDRYPTLRGAREAIGKEM